MDMTKLPSVMSRSEALADLAGSLRIASSGADETTTVSLPLIAQSLRRAAHILAPCPRHELERAVCRALAPLAPDDSIIEEQVNEALHTLIAYGDILEMKTQSDDAWAVSPLVIRPAPPSFVLRKNGTAIILGVAGDEITPLTDASNERIQWHGVLRTLPPQPGENLKEFLSEMGIVELSERLWLRLPIVESASSFLSHWNQTLAQQPHISEIENLQVIDPAQPSNFYKGRWRDPGSTMTGLYVGRRKQRYGSNLWCIVLLEKGAPTRLIDLSLGPYYERPCDVAWRIQMALDAAANRAQQYSMRTGEEGVIFDFYSPIPSWAERKLSTVGSRIATSRCLFTYLIPHSDRNEVTSFLGGYLWIKAYA
jgi:hypothetical protein